MKRMILILCAVAAMPAVAWAGDPKTPGEFFKLGEDEYNLGNFEKAIEAFKKGFALEQNNKNKSAYIYGIAQSYRQAKNCVQAEFFYKRFLSLRGDDIDPGMRKDVEDRINELADCAKKQADIAGKPPDGGTPPDDKRTPVKPDDKRVGTTEPVGPDKDPEKDPDDEPKVVKQADATPRVISLRAVGGGAKLSAGGLDVPVQATLAVLGGYPLAVNDKVTLDLGAGFSFTPVPFDNMDGDSKSAQLLAVFANVGATYHVASKVGIRGDLGGGLLLFKGISESPFTAFAPVSGTISMPHLRVGISADYAITPNFIATLAPFTFSYSPGKDGLETVEGDKIDSITAIDFMVGIGYRM
jgi:tetratricopeptide (TPR) repeat protein